MVGVSLKILGVWLLMVVAAVINGMIRDNVITRLMGEELSLSISGITLSGLVFLVAFLLVPHIGVTKPSSYFLVGLSWLGLTLVFEYIFGHYVLGKPWSEINQVFNLAEGNLFTIVLMITAISPWLVAKLNNLI